MGHVRSQVGRRQDSAPSVGSSSRRRELGRESLRGGDAGYALWHLRHALEADRDDSLTWRLIGRCFEELGELRRASMCHAVASRIERRRGQAGPSATDSPLTLGWERLKTRDV